MKFVKREEFDWTIRFTRTVSADALDAAGIPNFASGDAPVFIETDVRIEDGEVRTNTTAIQSGKEVIDWPFSASGSESRTARGKIEFALEQIRNEGDRDAVVSAIIDAELELAGELRAMAADGA